MKKRYAVLTMVGNNHTITSDSFPAFWYHIHNALLIALMEQKVLSVMQYRHVGQKLRSRQRKSQTKEIQR